ncbi:MAG TPA: hypothetical protein VE195_06685 [Acidobacteriaceae bacterium]|nr:hypothetical protein [Acidobacteriaceae bacterium]
MCEITGLGPVDMATAALCRKLGSHRIFGIDTLPERLQLARELGLCDEVVSSSADNAMEILALIAVAESTVLSNVPETRMSGRL